MARFKINDKIEFVRKSVVPTPIDVLRKGTIVKGPFVVDGVDHYQVKWDWINNEYASVMKVGKVDLISDLSSTKYEYR